MLDSLEQFPTYFLERPGKISSSDLLLEKRVRSDLADQGIKGEMQSPVTSISGLRDAKISYLKFLAQFGSDSVVRRRFIDHNARSILVEGKVADTDYYSDIAFFTEELIESRTGRFDIIIKSLKKLRLKIEHDRYHNMVSDLLAQIATNLTFYKEIQDSSAPADGVHSKPVLALKIDAKIRRAISNKQVALSQKIDRLKKYQQEALSLIK